MNKSFILDLIIESGGKKMEVDGVEGDWYMLDKFAFAEIIIKECIKQCEPAQGIRYSPNSLSARKNCKDKIISHFGL